MDNLAKCAFLAKKAGMSYGNWMAIYGEKIIKKQEKAIPKGWKECEWCKKLFRAKPIQRFCEPACRTEAYLANNKEKLAEKKRRRRMRYYERKKQNEGSC